MKTFTELWDWVMDRSSHGVMTVQNREELEHVYNLMKESECATYLEVGSAEGNSLYVLGHAVRAQIDIIDLGELHTEKPRNEVIKLLSNNVKQFLGDSTDPRTYFEKIVGMKYDCVLIDGGHDYSTVLSDTIMYGPLAQKYIFFHDIQLPEVKRAVEWFVKRWRLGRYYTYVSSETFGYGIVEIERER